MKFVFFAKRFRRITHSIHLSFRTEVHAATLGVFMLWCSHCLILHGEEPVLGEKLAQECIAARNSVGSGTIDYSIRVIKEGNRVGYQQIVRRCKVSFDEATQRIKWTKHWKSPRAEWTELFLKNQDGIFHDPGEWAQNAQFDGRKKDNPLEGYLSDPRNFGLSTSLPSSSDGEFPKGSFWFAFKFVKPSQSSKVEIDNQDLIKCIYYPTEKSTVTVWYLTESVANPYPIRIVQEYANNPMTVEIEVSHQRFPNHSSDSSKWKWFPSKIRYRQLDNGAVSFEEVLEVHEAVFGVRFRETEFERNSLPIIPDRNVSLN